MAHYIELLEKNLLSHIKLPRSCISHSSGFGNFFFFFFGKCEREVMKKINYILSLVNFHGDTLSTIHIAGQIA